MCINLYICIVLLFFGFYIFITFVISLSLFECSTKQNKTKNPFNSLYLFRELEFYEIYDHDMI